MGLTRPTSDPTWATGTSYPSGSDPWSGTPVRSSPSTGKRATGYTPNTGDAADEDNYLLGTHGDFVQWLALRIGMGFYGDGGARFQSVTMDGTTAVTGCTLSTHLGLPTYFATHDLFFLNLTVNSGVVFITSNFRLVVFDTLANNGHIHCDGQTATGISGQNAWPSGTLLGGTAGGVGGAAPTGSISGAGVDNPTTSTAAGGRGGLGGTGTYAESGGGITNGGSSGAVFSSPLSQGRDIMAAFMGCVFAYDATSGLMLGHPLAGGTGGGGGGFGDSSSTQASVGGGGGSGAGSLVLFAQTLINNGSITCNGGNGGPPTAVPGKTADNVSAAPGGGGGGGNLVVCASAYSGSGAMTANGGTVGSGGSASPLAEAGSSGRVAFYNLGA